VRELDLFRQYLVRQRGNFLERSHTALLGVSHFDEARIAAHQAELCDTFRKALKVLGDDAGEFIKQYLERGTSE